MATRIQQPTVPGEFIRLDDTVSDPDAFVDVRTMQVARDNNNILIARRTKKCILHYIRGPLTGTPFHSTAPASRESGDVVFFIPLIKISRYTKTLEVVIHASRVQSSAPCVLYPVVDSIAQSGVIDTNINFAVTATPASGGGKYSATCPIPAGNGIETALPQVALYIYMSGLLVGDDRGTANTLVDCGSDYLDVDTTPGGGVPNNNGMYVTTATELMIAPKVVCMAQNLTGNIYRYFLSHPLEIRPTPGANIVQDRGTQGVYLYSVSVYENSLSDFAADAGGY